MKKPSRLRSAIQLVPLLAGLSLWLFPQRLRAAASELVEPNAIDGLRIQREGRDTVLTWPSHPQERFVVLWRPEVSVEARWIELTNQLPASALADRTIFRDEAAFSRGPSMPTNANLGDFYRVFLIPDFWFDMDGVQLRGGPKYGEDFLPLYNGSKETWELFKPHTTLLVDGELSGDRKSFGADEAIERINFGTRKKPRWHYSRGLWFGHDTLPNGEHTLQLCVLLTLNNVVGDLSQYLTLTNRPVRMRINNEFSYPDWNPFIQSDTYTFNARSNTRQVNWRIDVHDSQGTLLASKNGRTGDGEIRWTWDLRDKRGRVHDDFDSDPFIASTLTTWPVREEIKGAQELMARSGAQVSTWWSDRLGRDFVRTPPSFDERRRRFVNMEPLPLEGRELTRPLELFIEDTRQ